MSSGEDASEDESVLEVVDQDKKMLSTSGGDSVATGKKKKKKKKKKAVGPDGKEMITINDELSVTEEQLKVRSLELLLGVFLSFVMFNSRPPWPGNGPMVER